MKLNYKKLGQFISVVDVRNKEGRQDNLLGVSTRKVFIDSVANTVGTDFKKYKIVKKHQFTYVPDTSRRGDKIGIAMLLDLEQALVSQAYTVFEVSDTDNLDPEYLMMWFRRPEFDRYARFKSHGSVREIFDWQEMCDVELPVPSIEKQREIVREYNVVNDRIALNEQLTQKLEDTAQAIYKQWFVDFEFPISKEYAEAIGKPELEGKAYKSSGGEMEYCEELERDIPRDWKLSTVKDFADKVVAGVIPKYVDYGSDTVLGQRSVHDNIIDLKFARLHTPKDDTKILKFGDILVNSTGAGTLGRVGQIYFETERLFFDSNMTLVRAKLDHHIDYLGCFIGSKQKHFVQICQGSTNQTRLYVSMIAPINILVPKEEVLKCFRDHSRTIRIYIQNNRNEIKVLEEIKTLTLSRLSKL